MTYVIGRIKKNRHPEEAANAAVSKDAWPRSKRRAIHSQPLRMTIFLNATKNLRHPEERPQGASRRTADVEAAATEAATGPRWQASRQKPASACYPCACRVFPATATG